MHRIVEKITINIGDYYVSRYPVIVKTILGSCVSVCLYDPVNMVGGMNHILLPGKADLKHYDDRSRYAINAMELLINEIMKKGGVRKNIVAKLFGGANVLPAIKNRYFVGSQNIQFVSEFLKTENIKIVSHDLGGTCTRLIYFNTYTGDVFVKRSNNKLLNQVIAKEKQWSKKVERETKRVGQVDIYYE